MCRPLGIGRGVPIARCPGRRPVGLLHSTLQEGRLGAWGGGVSVLDRTTLSGDDAPPSGLDPGSGVIEAVPLVPKVSFSPACQAAKSDFIWSSVALASPMSTGVTWIPTTDRMDRAASAVSGSTHLGRYRVPSTLMRLTAGSLPDVRVPGEDLAETVVEALDVEEPECPLSVDEGSEYVTRVLVADIEEGDLRLPLLADKVLDRLGHMGRIGNTLCS